MKIVGRNTEQELLRECLFSGRPEFLAVYGRRRVGKTFLIKEYFENSFSFYATGVPNQKTAQQLKYFHQSLQQYGCPEKKAPGDWLEAFSRLRKLLERDDAQKDPVSGKMVVFLDELPWMDTARSDFKGALDYFWNSWGSSREELLLIVCGSATSWIIKHILADTGGLYNRVTRTMHLQPFSLHECEEFYEANGVAMSRTQIIESYMIFGGIPYYLNEYNRRFSLAQNVDVLYFRDTGQLHFEYERLFRSLFKKSEKHIAVVEALAKRKQGLSRTQIIEETGISDGGSSLSTVLSELEQCGFIRKFSDYSKAKYGACYQLIDPFILFCNQTKSRKEIISWVSFTGTPGYYAWRGLAFEIVCLLHTSQLKKALGISGVDSMEYTWKSDAMKNGAQIDLLIDRRDQVVNLC
jgi:AAA+ ATPase superfamily predicted ATPase